MKTKRVPETSQGIQNAPDVAEFNIFARTMRDRGWIATDKIIKSGIVGGYALEVGPGPGYLGLEWLKKTQGTRLTGLEISQNMIDLACGNRQGYGFDSNRAGYLHGNAMEMPFEANTFDAVFSNGSLHEWERPEDIFDEIYRTLKPGGKFYISDLRRDISLPIRLFLYASTIPAMRKGLKSSLEASYTVEEAKLILHSAGFHNALVVSDAFGLVVSGEK